jgi:hypothetical protein
MTIHAFIRENRTEIDRAIARAMGRTVEELPHRNDRERRLWVLNDEGLYEWARQGGVNL